jgi:enamine deaminase RidA (YjgF/YER057c/UK114 family)
MGLEGVGGMGRRSESQDFEGTPVSLHQRQVATLKFEGERCDGPKFTVGAIARSVLRGSPNPGGNQMRILQPAEWSKPRGFSHGVEFNGPGRWIVLAGQTGGDEKGDYAPEMAGQVGTALKRIMKLLGEAGAGPEHIVRLTWYLTSRSDYEAAGPGIGAAWKQTLGRNFPPSTLLYIDGLVDARAKVEIEVTAFVPTA